MFGLVGGGGGNVSVCLSSGLLFETCGMRRYVVECVDMFIIGSVAVCCGLVQHVVEFAGMFIIGRFALSCGM